jgi:hypothetical protein
MIHTAEKQFDVTCYAEYLPVVPTKLLPNQWGVTNDAYE